MQGLTDEGQRIVADVAQRHGVSTGAVSTLLAALAAGGGRQAQFSHPDLGGMGQWSQGGMTMVGDMFNNGLKAKVDALCGELAGVLRGTSLFASTGPSQSQSQSSGQGQSQSGGMGGVSLFVPGQSGMGGARWPAELGTPSSSGSQDDLHYAVFPATRRLAIARGGQVTVYDIGDHRIGGFSQQQGGDQSLTFTSQYGLVRVADLPVVDAGAPTAAPVQPVPPPAEPAPPPASQWAPPPPPAEAPRTPTAQPDAGDDIFAKIERLADLHKKQILTSEEYAAKKAELLARI